MVPRANVASLRPKPLASPRKRTSARPAVSSSEENRGGCAGNRLRLYGGFAQYRRSDDQAWGAKPLRFREHGGGAGNRTRVRKPRTVCLYVRIRWFESRTGSTTVSLSRTLATCLSFAARPVARRLASQFVTPTPRLLTDSWGGCPSGCSGREECRFRHCVIVRNYTFRGFLRGPTEPRHAAKQSRTSVEADRPQSNKSEPLEHTYAPTAVNPPV